MVHTDDGNPLPYDRLVLATGAAPVVPGLPWARSPDGRLLDGVRLLRTLADALPPGTDGTDGTDPWTGAPAAVAVVGGGVLGVEAALALRRRGHRVALVHRGPYPLDRHLDARGGEALAGRLRALGVDLRPGRTVSSRGPGTLALDDGTAIDADQVLLCVGARPRVGLARAAGLAVRTGVPVDHLLRTSAARVHALGDCAEPLDGGGRGPFGGSGPTGRVPAGGFEAAWEQAERLAVLLTGGAGGAGGRAGRLSGDRGVLRLKAEELDLMRVGTPAGTDATVVLADAARGRYARLSLSGGKLTGAELVGLGRAAADVVRLHERGVPVPADRLALLLGRDPGYAAGPVPGTAVVCHCNNITGDALAAAWDAGSRTPEALGAATRAGHRLRRLPGRTSGPVCGLGARGGRGNGTDREHATSGSEGAMTGVLVVVGHGMVGHRLVREVRERDRTDAWRVVVLAGESRPAYDRIALSAYARGADPAELGLEGASFIGDDRVEVRLSAPVTRIDREEGAVFGADGTRTSYDALVLATGARPFVPPVPGHDLPGRHVYRTLEDVRAIRAAARPGRPAVVIGGGLLGLEAAGALAASG